MPTRSRRVPLLAMAMALALILAACGDSDDDETAAPADQTSSTATGGDEEYAVYCAAILAIETLPGPDIDFEALSPEQQKAAVATFFKDTIKPLASEVQAVTPDEIRADVATLIGAVDEASVSGDFDGVFETPEVKAAEGRAHQFDLANCGWAGQNVTAVNYAFQGVSSTIDAGPVSFDLTNQGTEVHEMTILKKSPGVTESFDELLQLPEAEGRMKTERVGGVDPTKPGESDYAVVNLEPGEYLIACFLPVGSTPEAFASETGPPDGPPHFTKGMKATLTVK
ncbi:MAG: hypothetical protein ACRD1K_18815 [Acidimicrobiales bacterium]